MATDWASRPRRERGPLSPGRSIVAVHFAGVAGATHGTVSLQDDGQVRFTPAPDFFGLASFGYLVADTKGNVTRGSAFVEIANVNDAPRVEAIEFGRPLYAYRHYSGYDAEGGYSTSITPVYDHAQALALYAAGEARDASGAPIGASTYQNGLLRPIALLLEDRLYSDGEGGAPSTTIRRSPRAASSPTTRTAIP